MVPREKWLGSKDPERAADALMMCGLADPSGCSFEGRCRQDGVCFHPRVVERSLAERIRGLEREVLEFQRALVQAGIRLERPWGRETRLITLEEFRQLQEQTGRIRPISSRDPFLSTPPLTTGGESPPTRDLSARRGANHV